MTVLITPPEGRTVNDVARAALQVCRPEEVRLDTGVLVQGIRVPDHAVEAVQALLGVRPAVQRSEPAGAAPQAATGPSAPALEVTVLTEPVGRPACAPSKAAPKRRRSPSKSSGAQPRSSNGTE
ncbi:hypothetical protein ACFU0X_10200 [Streptomyces cellulosae]|uniref:HMA domain-containing protein n=1 Tax=Streptomyces cellulosae TaxID=1968 RepID=A0ABW6JEP5_STRCE